MKERRRPRQVGELVRGELARLLREELRDPGIGFATITDVEMSPDLGSAKVHVSVLGGGPEQFGMSVAALNHAAGHLRGLIGRNLGLRLAPQLHFVEDHTLERGARIEEILRSIPKPESDGHDEGDE
jgi:ribosome-binding factor A